MTATDTALVLEDFPPRRLVSGNRRIHHYVRAEVCAMWRKLAHDTAVAAYGHADVGETWHQRVRIIITYRFPNKIRREVANLYPYVAKPLVDGLVDARVIPDDSDYHVLGPDPRRDFDLGPHRITIRIEDA
jgi:crossover junction endodeoxyribonuclease RusA